ncbi:TPA: hypothetical protein N6555_004600 [Escherichia coli]|nr:hypothetical protein [Escherichia coli]
MLAHSPTPIKNTSILRQNLLHVKQPSNPHQYWVKPPFYTRQLSLKYKYKDRAREACSKNKHPKATAEQRSRQQFTPAFSTAPVTENVGKTAYQVDGLTA